MKYNLDKEKFAALLQQRPSLIKKINLENIDTVAFLIKRARQCYEYLPAKLRADVRIIRAYIHLSKEERGVQKTRPYNNYRNRANLSSIPTYEQLTEDERVDLIMRSNNNGYLINYLHIPSKREWMAAVESGFTGDIPHEYASDKDIWEAHAKGLRDDNSIPRRRIPETFWEKHEDAELFIGNMIDIHYKFLFSVPAKHITPSFLQRALQSACRLSSELDLGFFEDYQEIPNSVWKPDNVRKALESDAYNIQIIPVEFLDEGDVLAAIKRGVDIERIPISLQTLKVKAHFVAGRKNSFKYYRGFIEKELKTLSFQKEVAKLEDSRISGAENIHEYVEPINRKAILKVCPTFLKFIPKLEQTDDIITIFFENATNEEVDRLAPYINLGKIKKKHAPVLIGCTNNLIVTAIEKKLKSHKKRKVLTSLEGTDTVEIDVPPSEYAKILSQM